MAEAGLDQMAGDWKARIGRWNAALTALSQRYAGEAEATMKNEAPWNDQSSNARNRLFGRAEVFDSDPSHYVTGFVLGHGMEYGIYLELGTRNFKDPPTTGQGNPSRVQSTGLVGYPIVHPTAEDIHTKFFADCEKILGSS